MLLKYKYIYRKPTEDELSAIFVICESWSRVLWENAGLAQRWNALQDGAPWSACAKRKSETKPEK